MEAILLEVGASHVTTIEYGEMESSHPQLTVLTPSQATRRWQRGELEFDGGVTYSSIEHSGLGRYGDILNPFGDIQAVAKAWCYTRPGGALLLGQLESETRDELVYNAHRVYGPRRWPHLLANWEQVDRVPVPKGRDGANAMLLMQKSKVLLGAGSRSG